MAWLIDEIRRAFAAPDPARFAAYAPKIENWHGELEGSKKKRRTLNERVVLVNEERHEFEFPEVSPYDGIEIPPYLTSQDIDWLRKKGLNPTNPNYTKAKQYFAKNPGCSNDEIVKASGIGDGTVKDVMSGFRANIKR